MRSDEAAVLQKEIVGIALMFGALFLISAILSYSPGDEAKLGQLAWNELFSARARDVAESIGNRFGLFGARVSSFFISGFIGYPVVLPLTAMFMLGWSLLRGRSLKPSIIYFLFSSVMSLLLATLFGLTTLSFSDLLSGAAGRMLAAYLSVVIGTTGASVLLVVLAVVFAAYMGRGVLEHVVQSVGLFLERLRPAVAVVSERVGALHRKKKEWDELRARKDALRRASREEPVADVVEGGDDAGIVGTGVAGSRSGRQERGARAGRVPVPDLKPGEVVMPFGSSSLPVRTSRFQRLDEDDLPEPEGDVVPDDGFDVGDAGGGVDDGGEPESGFADVLLSRPDEPEMVVNEGVHEQKADLDERALQVQTRDREPYRIPSIDLLDRVPDEDVRVDGYHLEESKRKLLDKLRIYKIEVKRISTTVGPRVTLFELELEPDVKVSRVISLEHDLAMALSARGIRIIAPIPGKNAVGIEIPNAHESTVWLRSVLQVERFKNSTATLPIVLGKSITNEVVIADLAAMPHLLIAGATGSGKSVCINVIISSLLYACRPDRLKFVMIDPKRVELFHYQHLKNHFLLRFPDIEEQIITDPQKAVFALRCVVKEMEMRYLRLEQALSRNIAEYNRRNPAESLPYIVVVIDELADLMITAGREVEEPITRLAQLARAVGIHLIVATQRPSVDVITGVIKANFPARIAFQVASRVDSRTILDGLGADQLLGNGDMLYQPANEPKPIRIQSPYVSSDEVERVTTSIGRQPGLKVIDVLPLPDPARSSSKGDRGGDRGSERGGSESRDELFEEAARLVVYQQQASVTYLQRALKIGFSRAGRLMDQLSVYGVVGEPNGSKPRDVLVSGEDSLNLLLRNID